MKVAELRGVGRAQGECRWVSSHTGRLAFALTFVFVEGLGASLFAVLLLLLSVCAMCCWFHYFEVAGAASIWQPCHRRGE